MEKGILQESNAFRLAGFETINDKVLREMNERAKGIAQKFDTPGSPTRTQTSSLAAQAASNSRSPRKGHKRYSSIHRRQFAKMDSIANHYAVKRANGTITDSKNTFNYGSTSAHSITGGAQSSSFTGSARTTSSTTGWSSMTSRSAQSNSNSNSSTSSSINASPDGKRTSAMQKFVDSPTKRRRMGNSESTSSAIPIDFGPSLTPIQDMAEQPEPSKTAKEPLKTDRHFATPVRRLPKTIRPPTRSSSSSTSSSTKNTNSTSQSINSTRSSSQSDATTGTGSRLPKSKSTLGLSPTKPRPGATGTTSSTHNTTHGTLSTIPPRRVEQMLNRLPVTSHEPTCTSKLLSKLPPPPSESKTLKSSPSLSQLRGNSRIPVHNPDTRSRLARSKDMAKSSPNLRGLAKRR
uniref:ARAD1B19690p n=1 Tax=Blastobotrys adeninivorans TaxID=409370 RepID=A0A060TCZ0_BLAAD